MVTLNPMPVTDASGSFFISSQGYVAGTVYPNAAARMFLQAAVIDPSASSSAFFYGGVGITAKIVNPGGSPALSSALDKMLDLATAVGNLTGFAVFDQSAAGIQTPNSQVPTYSPGQSLNFYGFGSGACIKLPISNTNAQALLGVADNTALSWDYTNQVVIPYTNTGANAGAIPGTVWNTTVTSPVARIIDVQVGNSMIVAVNSPSTGLASWTANGSVVVLEI